MKQGEIERGNGRYCSTRCAAIANPKIPHITRFYKYIVPQENGCWLWEGRADRYGSMNIDGKFIQVHRYSYELYHGAFPPGKTYACHTCDNCGCVNPAHLFAGDAVDNAQDMIKKGRAAWQKGSMLARDGSGHFARKDV
jgi:hypothetical protein